MCHILVLYPGLSELKAKLSGDVYFATSGFKLLLSSGINTHIRAKLCKIQLAQHCRTKMKRKFDWKTFIHSSKIDLRLGWFQNPNFMPCVKGGQVQIQYKSSCP